MPIIEIDQSVGAGGGNLPLDVQKIGESLTVIGPGEGGVSMPPSSIGDLIRAIYKFQEFQNLLVRDGKVDKDGSTLRRINQLLNPNIPVPSSGQPGSLRYMPEMTNYVKYGVYSPIEQSLKSDFAFRWNVVAGGGVSYYFELTEKVVPNWFGVLVPDGISDFSKVHIFFHPTPGQVYDNHHHQVYPDSTYQAKTNWGNIFHYLNKQMAAQFCAANTGYVMVMPLLTTGAAETCGIFPQRWESLVGQMLGRIASENMSSNAAPQSISSVVVSSFSAGITYSAAFRQRANLGGRLRGIIDFDGAFSSYKAKSLGLPHSAIKMWQSVSASSASISALAATNLFPLPEKRWEEENSPYKGKFKHSTLAIHGAIPQSMMYFAAKQIKG